MATYITDIKIPHRGMRMSHLLADTAQELHAMAQLLQLPQDWFQNTGMPHYNICQTKRETARKLGAQTIGRKQAIDLIRETQHALAA